MSKSFSAKYLVLVAAVITIFLLILAACAPAPPETVETVVVTMEAQAPPQVVQPTSTSYVSETHRGVDYVAPADFSNMDISEICPTGLEYEVVSSGKTIRLGSDSGDITVFVEIPNPGCMLPTRVCTYAIIEYTAYLSCNILTETK